MAVDLGLNQLVTRVRDSSPTAVAFASNLVSLFQAAFLSDRNPFGTAAVDKPFDPTTITPAELSLPVIPVQYAGATTPFRLVLPSASGGAGSYTYTLTDADDTPLSIPGLAFDANTRTLSGTPTTAKRYSVKYSVSDDSDTLSRTFTIEVRAASAPLFVPGIASQTFNLNENVNLTLPAATGGSGSYTYIVNFPSDGSFGLSFDGTTRILSGRPDESGNFLLEYLVSDGRSSIRKNFRVLVRAATITTGSFVGWAPSNRVDKELFRGDIELDMQFEFDTAYPDYASRPGLPDSWFVLLSPGDNEVGSGIVKTLAANSRNNHLSMNFDGLRHLAPEVAKNLYLTYRNITRNRSFTIRGPDHPTNQKQDATDPYGWTPNAAGLAAARAFFDASRDGDIMTLTMRYDG